MEGSASGIPAMPAGIKAGQGGGWCLERTGEDPHLVGYSWEAPKRGVPLEIVPLHRLGSSSLQGQAR